MSGVQIPRWTVLVLLIVLIAAVVVMNVVYQRWVDGLFRVLEEDLVESKSDLALCIEELAFIGEERSMWDCDHSCDFLEQSRDRAIRESLRWKEQAIQCVGKGLEVKNR